MVDVTQRSELSFMNHDALSHAIENILDRHEEIQDWTILYTQRELGMRYPGIDFSTASTLAKIATDPGLSKEFDQSLTADAIERMLKLMGATRSAREWTGKRSDGEARGKANRLANFDDANMRRSAKAAAEASEKVQHAFEVLGDNIPDNLRQAGQLRIDHVDKSLEELGKIAEPQITKDAIAGRIRRLLQLAEKTEKARAAEGK